MLLGVLCTMAEEHAEAEAHYRAVVAAEPGHAAAHCNLNMTNVGQT